MPSIYHESFDHGPSGWYSWISNSAGPKALEWRPGDVTSRSPWWIDYNHAPPGAGYLHMVHCLNTTGPVGEHHREIAGPNRFVEERFPIDFTNAVVETAVRGELTACGAQLVWLVQGTQSGKTSPWLLTSDPIPVTDKRTSHRVVFSPNESLWTSLGSRHDRIDMYGSLPLATVLGNVTNNIMLVLFPLDVAPMGPLHGDPHKLRPERDYPVWRHRLPEGYVTLEEIKITFGG